MKKILLIFTLFLYILVIPFSANAATITADWLLPKIVSISEIRAFNNGPIHLTIKGYRFSPSATAKLTKEGATDIIATDLVITTTMIQCTFDLTEQPIGAWSIIVTNSSSLGGKDHSAILKKALIVDSATPEINSISPKNIDFRSASLIQAKIFGANFRKDVKVKMVGPDGQIINGIQPKIPVDTQINLKFDLTGQPIGSYEVIVTNADGKSASLKYFKIKEPDFIPPLTKKSKLSPSQAVMEEPKSVEPVLPSAVTPTPAPTSDQSVNPASSPVLQNESKPIPEIMNTEPSPKAFSGSIEEINQQLKPIFFDVDKFNIGDSQYPTLEKDLILLRNNPGFLIVIAGYADERGSDGYNLNLSEKRAEAVAEFLASNGIASKMIIFPYGKEAGSGPNSHTEDQWQQNRRAEISLWEKQPTREQAALLNSKSL